VVAVFPTQETRVKAEAPHQFGRQLSPITATLGRTHPSLGIHGCIWRSVRVPR